MKNNRLFITFFLSYSLFCSYIQGQTIQLTFTGLGNGQNVQLDSIKVRNLIQGGDTTLYWPDTVLLFVFSGRNDSHLSPEKRFDVFQNTPNPFRDKTLFRIYVPGDDVVEVEAYDLYGRKTAALSKFLLAGEHTLKFTAGNELCNIITVHWRTEGKSLKMINTSGGHGKQSELIYTGFTGHNVKKQPKLLVLPLPFSIGDYLLFRGYHNGDSAGFADPVLNSQIYFMEFGVGYPCIATPYFSYGGHTYHTVQIGTQCWMRENLNIGVMITGTQASANNGIIEKYCYNNDTGLCALYGGLYDWHEMMQYSTTPGVQGICPNDWHIPTEDEWCTLTTFLDPSVDCNFFGYSGTDAGGKMKETKTGGWLYPNTGATNESGFSALGAGYRVSNGNFQLINDAAVFWSSVVLYTPTRYMFRGLDAYNATVKRWYGDGGKSVRCIKN